MLPQSHPNGITVTQVPCPSTSRVLVGEMSVPHIPAPTVILLEAAWSSLHCTTPLGFHDHGMMHGRTLLHRLSRQ